MSVSDPSVVSYPDAHTVGFWGLSGPEYQLIVGHTLFLWPHQLEPAQQSHQDEEEFHSG